MAPPTEPALPPSNDTEMRDETITDLMVEGTIPAGLSGRLLGIGPGSHPDGSVGGNDGMVHSVHLHAGRAVSFRSRWVITDAVAQRLRLDLSPGPRNSGPDIVAHNLVAFGGSILALGDGSLAYELASDLATLRRVDLAGQSRAVAPYPKRDPATGDLHVLATDASGSQAHVVVSSRALTRASRPIVGAPQRTKDLAISRDRVVFVTDGFVGVAPRDGEAHITWITTGVDAPRLVHAHDAGDSIVVYAITPSLERWTLHARSATVHREVLDPTPQRSALTNAVGGEPRFLWTTADGTADRHDLVNSAHASHALPPECRGDDFVLVADEARRSDADGGWLIGFVHHAGRDVTDLVVLDAADVARPAIATVRIPRRIARGLHSAWLPSTLE